MDGQKKMPVSEFAATGYLQEVNRRLLHPLGLALEATVAHEPTAMLFLAADDLGRLRHLCRKLAALDAGEAETMGALDRLLDTAVALDPGDGYLSGVWDARDDPEGVVFSEVDPGKAARVADELQLRALAREAALGYVIQPAPR